MTKRDTLYLDLGIAYACCFLLRGAAVAKRIRQIEAYAKEHPPLEDKKMKYPFTHYTTNLTLTFTAEPSPQEIERVIEHLNQAKSFIKNKNTSQQEKKKKYPWHKVQGHRRSKKRA